MKNDDGYGKLAGTIGVGLIVGVVLLVGILLAIGYVLTELVGYA